MNKEKTFFENLIWLSSKEASEYLRISENNLRTKVSRGQIMVNGRLNGRWRFKREELDRLLETSKSGGSHA